MNKYKLLRKRKDGLHRIKAIRDIYFKGVVMYPEGTSGGLVSGYHNLSQEGSCWVDDNAVVTGNAVVTDDATVSDNAVVMGNSRLEDNAWVSENARIIENAIISKDAHVKGHALISGKARITDYAFVNDHSFIEDNAIIGGRTKVEGCSCVKGDTDLGGRIRILSSMVMTGGEWREQPPIVITASYHVYATSYDAIGIGCQRYSIEWWRENVDTDRMSSLRYEEGLSKKEFESIERAFEFVVSEIEIIRNNLLQ